MEYLKHISTGDVYPANRYLALRGDMVPCNLDGSTDEEEAKPKRAPRKAKATPDDLISGLADIADVDVSLD